MLPNRPKRPETLKMPKRPNKKLQKPPRQTLAQRLVKKKHQISIRLQPILRFVKNPNYTHPILTNQYHHKNI